MILVLQNISAITVVANWFKCLGLANVVLSLFSGFIHTVGTWQYPFGKVQNGTEVGIGSPALTVVLLYAYRVGIKLGELV